MFFYALTALVNGITTAILGIFIYSKNKKEVTNRAFARFCLAVVVWSFGYFMWQVSTTAPDALFWSRVLMAGSIFIPITFFHFVVVFLNILEKEKRMLISGYFLSISFFVFNFTPLFIDRVESVLLFSYWPRPGILFHFFHLMFIFFAFYFWNLLLRAHKNTSGIKKLQIIYVLAGSFIGFTGGATNHFLWYNIPIYPIGNFAPAIGFLFIGYGIVKYRLLNIRVILTEFLVGLIGLILLIQALASPSFLGFGLLLLFSIVGYLLIKSVLLEIARREELEKLNSELAIVNIKLKATYNKLEKIDIAKTEFISMASHQLRTPLSAIKGYVSMLIEGSYGGIPEKAKEKLKNVFSASERLIKIVNELLNISKIELGKMELEKEEVKIEDLIESCYEEMKIDIKESGLKFIWERPKPLLPKIKIDQYKIRQVILNLIDNAVKYTQKGKIEVRVKKIDSKILTSIEDTGEGLTPKEKDKLFEGFSRGTAGTAHWIEGAGLGLYVSKKYIELHRGRIWVESDGRDKGSTFYFELPIK